MWAGRILMLEYIFADEPDADDPAMDVSAEAIDSFQKEFSTWLTQGTYTPFSTIIDWMSYGRGYRNKEGGTPRVVWEDGGSTISFQGERIRVEDFQRMAQAALRETEDALQQVTFGQWGRLERTIELRKIVDSLIYEGPGRSFATNRKNSWLGVGAAKLAALGRTTLWRAVTTANGRVDHEIRRAAVTEYLIHIRRLRSGLLESTHIWGGQPGRGPEVMTIKHCDTEQLVRNTFVYDGQVLLVTDRDKNKSIRGIGRKVARFLPDELSRMFVAYVAWVLPFERVLHALSGIRGPADADGAWLWKDGRKGVWKTEQLSERLDLLSSAQLGVKLTVMSYRHVAIEFGRRIKGLMIRQAEMEAAAEDDGEHETIDPHTGEARDQLRLEYLWDLQATHGSRIARNHYAVQVMFPNQLQPEMIANFREVSRLWHEFLYRSDGAFGGKRLLEESEGGREADVHEVVRQEKDVSGQTGKRVGDNKNKRRKVSKGRYLKCGITD
jgi:hypothetical protein